jgi:oligopeptide transport system ATP-binding protein
MCEPQKTDAMPLLQVKNLRTYFHTRNGVVRAVDDVSFEIEKGETLGIVGESGSGKSVTCYSLLGLIPQPPGRIESGEAIFDNTDLLKCSTAELNRIRGKRIAMIFQDQLIEPLLIHEKTGRQRAVELGVQALKDVGIQDAAQRIRSYPHEFSGGMRQRVMIAMALITKPDLLIADEPTTALDVTVQAQIIELVKRMQAERGMAVIWISHDLGVVAGLCQRVNVMYAGRVVESGPTDSIYRTPKHPYNRALQKSIPALQPKGAELYTIAGIPPDLSKPVAGCAFVPRCEFAQDICRAPVELKTGASGQATACVRVQNGELKL